MDAYKFFDSFEPEFTGSMHQACGIEPDLADMFCDLSTKAERHIKIGKTYGEAMDTFNGLGQGDSLALMSAIIYVALQHRFLAAQFPKMRMSSAIDDRNLRASVPTLQNAFTDIVDFDHAAGHITNPEKAAASALDAGDRLKLSEIDDKLKIFITEKCVGETITVTNKANKQYANQRADFAISAAKKNAQAPVNQNLKCRGTTMLVLPRLVSGLQWLMPTKHRLNTIASIIIFGIFGKKRQMRAPEIVGAVIHDPSKVHPIGAIVIKNLMSARRLCLRDPNKRNNIIEAIQILQNEAAHRIIPGPAYSLVNIAAILGVQIRCEGGTLLYVPENGPPLDLFTRNNAFLKTYSTELVRQSILRGLQARVQKDKPDRKGFS